MDSPEVVSLLQECLCGQCTGAVSLLQERLCGQFRGSRFTPRTAV